MVSGIARLGKLVGHNWPTDCFNRSIFDCSIRVSRSFSNLGGRAQQAFGRVWALPGPPLATPLHVVVAQTHVAGSERIRLLRDSFNRYGVDTFTVNQYFNEVMDNCHRLIT